MILKRELAARAKEEKQEKKRQDDADTAVVAAFLERERGAIIQHVEEIECQKKELQGFVSQVKKRIKAASTKATRLRERIEVLAQLTNGLTDKQKEQFDVTDEKEMMGLLEKVQKQAEGVRDTLTPQLDEVSDVRTLLRNFLKRTRGSQHINKDYDDLMKQREEIRGNAARVKQECWTKFGQVELELSTHDKPYKTMVATLLKKKNKAKKIQSAMDKAETAASSTATDSQGSTGPKPAKRRRKGKRKRKK